MNKRIEVIVKTGLKTKDGREFTAYKAVKSDGKYLDLSFTREVPITSYPTEHCYINVDSSNISVDNNRKYPRCYIRAIESIEPYFNGTKLEDSDLPF